MSGLPVRVYASTTATTEPETRAALSRPPGAFPEWQKLSPTMVEQFNRETKANGGLVLSQVPRTSDTTVAWFWQCVRGHRWRETMYSRLDYGMSSQHTSRKVPRWKSIAGSRAACRQCVLEDFGSIYAKCGCVDPDLNHVNKPQQFIAGWCRDCRDNAGPRLGEAFHSFTTPPTSSAEETLRALLSVHLPIVTPEEANSVRVRATSWGALRVFPDMLIPSSRVAIEYDSPGPFGDMHQDDSIDAAKDLALRDVGWEVIRVRTGGLALTSRWDVLASGPTQKAAAAVVAMHERVLASG